MASDSAREDSWLRIAAGNVIVFSVVGSLWQHASEVCKP